MPFVEPWLAPAAVPPQARFIPTDLLDEIDTFFQGKVLRELPVPVLRLPLAHVRTPWWLVLVAHEVGHHVQYQLGAGEELAKGYQTAVGKEVRKAVPGAASEWEKWADELFADAVSVLLAGPTAIRAVVALERATGTRMNTRREHYPPVVVRLKFLAAVAEKIGLAALARRALDGIDPGSVAARDPEAKRDVALAESVAAMTIGPLPELLKAPLPRLCGLGGEHPGPAASAASGLVDGWRDELKTYQATARDTLEAARFAAAGTWEAYEFFVENYLPKAGGKIDPNWLKYLEGDLEKLAGHAIQTIRESRVEGERAGEEISDQTGMDFGARLGQALLDAQDDLLAKEIR